MRKTMFLNIAPSDENKTQEKAFTQRWIESETGQTEEVDVALTAARGDGLPRSEARLQL